MDKYGLQSWHDYVSLAILAAVVLASLLFLVWERQAKHGNDTGRLRRRYRLSKR